jgi:hypothetical protein
LFILFRQIIGQFSKVTVVKIHGRQPSAAQQGTPGYGGHIQYSHSMEGKRGGGNTFFMMFFTAGFIVKKTTCSPDSYSKFILKIN